MKGGQIMCADMKNISTTSVVPIFVLILTAFPYFIAKQVEFLYRDYPNVFTGKMARSPVSKLLFPYRMS